MPQIDFAPEHKQATAQDIDRLKLKKDEKARIVCLEKPTYTYVHTLRAPKIVAGKPVMVTKDRRNGEQYQDYDMDFVGRPQCLGDLGILADKGVDATNCPICAASRTGDEAGPPERRFAMNVIRYGLNRDGALVTPFSCTCVVWGFPDSVYNKLVDIAEEHGSIIGRDLVLGPCTNEGFQKFEIGVGAKNVWQTDETIKQIVVETFKANRLEEVERACGRRAERRYMEQDLDNIAQRWRIARGDTEPLDGTEAVDHVALTAGLNDLLGETTPAGSIDTPPATSSASSVDIGELNFTTVNAPDPVQPKKPEAQPALDFDSLLNDL